MSDASGRPVGSVARALALLDALAEGPAGVNALARRIEVNPSSASRLLATLESGGLVEREPGGPYRLGLHLVALADRVLARLDVLDVARPQLRALVDESGETATLSVPGGDEAVIVDFAAGESSVVSMARLGRPSIPHATAVGKVLLAYAGGDPPGVLAAYTERTITEPERLAAELAAVRERGWADAVGEREPDLNALAAPVFRRGGELAAILGLQGPAARLTAPRRAELLPRLRAAAAAVSRALGGA